MPKWMLAKIYWLQFISIILEIEKNASINLFHPKMDHLFTYWESIGTKSFSDHLIMKPCLTQLANKLLFLPKCTNYILATWISLKPLKRSMKNEISYQIGPFNTSHNFLHCHWPLQMNTWTSGCGKHVVWLRRSTKACWHKSSAVFHFYSTYDLHTVHSSSLIRMQL